MLPVCRVVLEYDGKALRFAGGRIVTVLVRPLPYLVSLCRNPTSDLMMVRILLYTILLEFLPVDFNPRRDAI